VRTISIAGDERPLATATVGWIRDSVRALTSRGMPVCVRVSISDGSLNLLLSTPGCNDHGRARELNNEEKKIIDLWMKRGLDQADIDEGQLIAFVNEIKH
jgi:hypothetical protein